MSNYLLDRELSGLNEPQTKMKLLEDGSEVAITMPSFFWSWYDLAHPTLEERSEAKILSELVQIASYNSCTLDNTVSRWVIDTVRMNDRINKDWTDDWFYGDPKRYYGDEAELKLEVARRAEEKFKERKNHGDVND